MILWLCLKIFFVRIIDVSLATVATILIIKEKKLMASIIGFIEIAIWFSIIRQAITTTQSGIWITLAYAGGFATGTYIGSIISERYIQGNFGVKVITEKKDEIITILHDKGYGVSAVNIEGTSKEHNKYMLFIEIDKKRFDELRTIIKKIDSKAFIIVSDTKYVQNGYFK